MLPELIEIIPLDKPVHAEITVPGSKSITNRALILAALADGETTLRGALWSEDTQIMVDCLQKLGFTLNVKQDPDEFCNRIITVRGLGGKIPNGGTADKPLELFVGNAGTAARFLSALVCLGNGVYRLSGVPRMHERPQAALLKALRELGYRVDSQNDKLPAVIHGMEPASRRSTQPLQPKYKDSLTSSAPGGGARICTVSIEKSSQFASALLLCAEAGGWQVKVVGENAEESPYVAMTSKMLEVFPKHGGEFQIEPDASSASYFSGANWFLERLETVEAAQTGQFSPSKIYMKLSQTNRWQIDSAFDELVRPIAPAGHSPMSLDNPPSELPRTISRMNEIGDSIMTIIVISPFFGSTVSFTDLGRLRLQETERVVALRTELTKCGAKVVEDGDTLTVYPVHPSQLHGAEIETYDDHRMAMCFAILGLKVAGIKIKNPACVKKTFPNFFQKLAAAPPKGLGAEIRDVKTGRKLEHDELFAD